MIVKENEDEEEKQVDFETLADEEDDFDLLDADIDPFDIASLKKRDELLLRVEFEK